MTDYSKLSDFEINKRVAEFTLGGEWFLPVGHPENSSEDIWCNSNFYANELPDYCNSWADAGSILLESRIGIEPSITSSRWVAQAGYFRIASGHDNPLRAAMIVYLMMQEDKS